MCPAPPPALGAAILSPSRLENGGALLPSPPPPRPALTARPAAPPGPRPPLPRSAERGPSRLPSERGGAGTRLSHAALGAAILGRAMGKGGGAARPRPPTSGRQQRAEQQTHGGTNDRRERGHMGPRPLSPAPQHPGNAMKRIDAAIRRGAAHLHPGTDTQAPRANGVRKPKPRHSTSGYRR